MKGNGSGIYKQALFYIIHNTDTVSSITTLTFRFTRVEISIMDKDKILRKASDDVAAKLIVSLL